MNCDRSVFNEKGFALIMTIWVIIFLTIAAMSFSLSTRWSMTSTHNFRQETEAYYLALSGVDIARGYLMNDSDPRIDYIDEKGAFYVDREHEPLEDKISLYKGTVEITITDEQARINLNRTNQRNLRKLLQYAGVEPDREDAYVDSLLDWIDADDAHHLNGAEDEYYEDLGYKSKNGPLDTVEELLLVKEYSEDLLYGSEEYRALYRLLTTFGDGTFNVNTADQELMGLLGVSEIDIENVMRYRDSETGGLSSVPSGLRSFGFTTTFTRYVRVSISAEVKESGIKYLITTVMKRVPEKDGYRLETVFWREDVQYS